VISLSPKQSKKSNSEWYRVHSRGQGGTRSYDSFEQEVLWHWMIVENSYRIARLKIVRQEVNAGTVLLISAQWTQHSLIRNSTVSALQRTSNFLPRITPNHLTVQSNLHIYLPLGCANPPSFPLSLNPRIWRKANVLFVLGIPIALVPILSAFFFASSPYPARRVPTLTRLIFALSSHHHGRPQSSHQLPGAFTAHFTRSTTGVHRI